MIVLATTDVIISTITMIIKKKKNLDKIIPFVT